MRTSRLVYKNQFNADQFVTLATLRQENIASNSLSKFTNLIIMKDM